LLLRNVVLIVLDIQPGISKKEIRRWRPNSDFAAT